MRVVHLAVLLVLLCDQVGGGYLRQRTDLLLVHVADLHCTVRHDWLCWIHHHGSVCARHLRLVEGGLKPHFLTLTPLITPVATF